MKNRISPLSKDEFYQELVPFFEEKREKLLGLLKSDKSWSDKLLPYRLVFINNREIEDKSYLYVFDKLPNHIYLQNKKPHAYKIGYSSKVMFNENLTYLHIIDMLRKLFIGRIIKIANIENIFSYFKKLISSNYANYEFKKTEYFLQLSIFNLKVPTGFFAISAYRVNLIFPFKESLKSDAIRDGTADNKKILITNKEKIDKYEGFDEILNFNDLAIHFSLFGFTEGIQIYKEITGLNDLQIFSIIDLLKTTGDSEIYDFKKELIYMNLSDGKVLEKYFERFLRLCFGDCYDNLMLKSQVPSRRGLRRRDFIIYNNNSNNPFLKSLENKGIELLLFDSKNYGKKLTTRNIDTFKAYLDENSAFGNFGVILSRRGASSNCQESIFRWLMKHNIKIIVFEQEDILRMLDYLDNGRSPIDVLQQKYMELLFQT